VAAAVGVPSRSKTQSVILARLSPDNPSFFNPMKLHSSLCSVRVLPVVCAVVGLLGVSSLSAQLAASPTPATSKAADGKTPVIPGTVAVPVVPDPDEVVKLTPFVVETDTDKGYQSASTLAGTRLRTELRDVGAAISVVNAQFLADTGSTNTKDILVYTTGTEASGPGGNFSGVSTGNNFSNAEANLQSPNVSTRVRGLSGADLTRDFFPTDIGLDSYNTERVDISRGANAILFGLGSPAGIINNQLKT
jgi:outer membrane receptor protein involved in Fe transport